MKNKWVLGIIVVVSLIILMLVSEDSEAANREGRFQVEPYLGIGSTYANSNMTTAELGIHAGKYGLGVELIGRGTTSKGYEDSVKPIFSVYRTINPSWCRWDTCFKSGIGVSYSPDQQLVGPANFRLEMILSYKEKVEVFIRHYSSGGLYETNTGLDTLGLRLML